MQSATVLKYILIVCSVLILSSTAASPGSVSWTNSCPDVDTTSTINSFDSAHKQFSYLKLGSQILGYIPGFSSWKAEVDEAIKGIEERLNVRFSDLHEVKRSQDSVVSVKCATVTVPLLWGKDDSRTINFFVRKYLSRDATKRIGQLWLLNGGPGLPGDAFHSIASQLVADLDDQFDILVPDHRGTGNSDKLVCSLETTKITSSWDATRCFNELNDSKYPNGGLAGFSTTGAAKDVEHVMTSEKASNGGNSEVIVAFGVSYGTYWLNRILQVAPANLIQAAAFDSIVNPATTNWLQWDYFYNEATERFFQLCEADTWCGAKFAENTTQGGGVIASVLKANVRQGSQTNRCHFGITQKMIRSIISYLMEDPDNRRLILPFFYRLNRCTVDDWRFVDSFYNMAKTAGMTSALSSLAADSTGSISWPLYRNIMCAELIQRQSDFSSKRDTYSGESSLQPFYGGFTDVFNYDMCAAQKSYYKDEYVSMENKYHSFTGPMLTMHGMIDPKSPFTQALSWKQYMDAQSSQHAFLAFENSGHSLITNTPRISDPTDNCAQSILVQFVKFRTKAAANLAYAACLADMKDYPTYNFESTTTKAASLGNVTVDIWNEGPTTSLTEIANKHIGINVVIPIIVACIVGSILLAIAIFVLIKVIELIKRKIEQAKEAKKQKKKQQKEQ